MTVLVWLAIPLGATLLAVLWVLWLGRTRPPADIHETLGDYERFKRVFDQPRWREGRREPPDGGPDGVTRRDDPDGGR